MLHWRWLPGVWIVVLLVGLLCGFWAQPRRIVPLLGASAPHVPSEVLAPPSRPAPATGTRLKTTYGKLPLHFEANQGQTDPQVQFLARAPGYALFLTPTEAILHLRPCHARRAPCPPDTPAATVVRAQLVQANVSPEVVAEAPLPGLSNYFIGNDPQQWHTAIPNYARVRYRHVYPGIDLVYYGTHGRLEFDFVVAPGADPGIITLGFQGMDALEVDDHGDLVLRVPGGAVYQYKPVVYQEVNGVRQPIAGHYVRVAEHQVGFAVADYDASKALVIDPVLVYATYLGGTGTDEGVGGFAQKPCFFHSFVCRTGFCTKSRLLSPDLC